MVQEGSGTAVMSAYVEIVFDNSDGRFPVRSTREALTIDWKRGSHTKTHHRFEKG